MTDSSTRRPDHYAASAKWLHWLTALSIFIIIPVGIIMHEMKPGALQNQLYDFHRSMGFVVLVLVVLRFAVRMGKGAPSPYVGLTAFERIASTTAHHLLYVLLFAMPLVGWLMTNAYSASLDVSVFGLFKLPHLIGENKALYSKLQQAHEIGGITMAVIVFIHVGGALMHTFVKRDTVLWRMLPRKWGEG
ncbi:MAG: cytochrome b/b6 domain-containing protein [Beijerinckiaceae bacterium]|nr:cytochrome b/b6 domain-containing protein [Beijerinckiaceae bacterium]